MLLFGLEFLNGAESGRENVWGGGVVACNINDPNWFDLKWFVGFWMK